MKTSSTGSAPADESTPREPATDGTPGRRQDTRASVDGEAAPRLPHERDESADSAAARPDPKIRQAQRDVESGKTQTDRGEATDELYRRTLRDR